MQTNPDDRSGVTKVAITDILTKEQLDHVIGLMNDHANDLELTKALKAYLGGFKDALLEKGVVADYLAYWLLHCKTEIIVNNVMDEARRNASN